MLEAEESKQKNQELTPKAEAKAKAKTGALWNRTVAILGDSEDRSSSEEDRESSSKEN